jgi:predicted lipoprotein with Yx(FWY)xxD motif
MRIMCRLFAIAVVIALVAVTSSAAYTVAIRSNDAIGNYLVNGNGMTLYYFDNDMAGTSTCFDSCATTWPPFYAESIDIPTGLSYEDFQQISRVDGVYQTTYKGRPLYLYSGDRNPGEINGEGTKGMWFAVKP